jgi:hypothetical protein
MPEQVIDNAILLPPPDCSLVLAKHISATEFSLPKISSSRHRDNRIPRVEPVEALEQGELRLLLRAWRCVAGSRSAPAGRSSPGCRSAPRRRSDRQRPACPSRATHQLRVQRRVAGYNNRPGVDAASSTRSRTSAVGMLTRLSSWVSASTGAGPAVRFLPGGIAPSPSVGPHAN